MPVSIGDTPGSVVICTTLTEVIVPSTPSILDGPRDGGLRGGHVPDQEILVRVGERAGDAQGASHGGSDLRGIVRLCLLRTLHLRARVCGRLRADVGGHGQERTAARRQMAARPTTLPDHERTPRLVTGARPSPVIARAVVMRSSCRRVSRFGASGAGHETIHEMILTAAQIALSTVPPRPR